MCKIWNSQALILFLLQKQCITAIQRLWIYTVKFHGQFCQMSVVYKGFAVSDDNVKHQRKTINICIYMYQVNSVAMIISSLVSQKVIRISTQDYVKGVHYIGSVAQKDQMLNSSLEFVLVLFISLTPQRKLCLFL